MSTFDGVVAEFPDIRIDHFRQTQSQRPPLLYLLSHVHSDHLQGLESQNRIFIWCSPATRELLLRLEKYPHRMNFARGILESRQQTYRHLKKLLRPIPLDTPTEFELVPGRSIRVTLLDANHCVGAVMFLIEGDGKAILYTGDIRAEVWWVNALIRNPVIVPYARHSKLKAQKQLDTIYLDTTFAQKSDRYRHFPTKAEGISELLEKVALYPRETEFYIDAWTFGYEDVWQALSTFLRSQIHVDDYRYGLYNALANGAEPKAPEAYKLIRAQIGNEEREGCLTTRYRRLHSCERGTGCDIFDKDFVRITPIISRYNGADMVELGAGGGQGDLNQRHELDLSDPDTFQKLMSLCVDKLHAQPTLLSSVVQMLTKATEPDGAAILLELADLTIEAESHAATQSTAGGGGDADDLPLERLVCLLAKLATRLKSGIATARTSAVSRSSGELPKQITFPYSRHASYGELCYMVEALLPKDIYPCTVDKSNWGPEHTMAYLFGHLYSVAQTFKHDRTMLQQYNADGQYDDAGSADAQSQYEDMETQLSATSEEHRTRTLKNSATSPIARRANKHPTDHNDHVEAKRIKRFAQRDAPTHMDLNERSRSGGVSSVGDAKQLFVRYFPYEADEGDLWRFFASFDVESVHIPGFNGSSRHSTRYAFVHVRTAAEAQRAIRELDGKTLLSSKVQIKLANEIRYGNSGTLADEACSRRDSSDAHRDSRSINRSRAADSHSATLDNVAERVGSEVSVAEMIEDQLKASRRRSIVLPRPGSHHGRQARHSSEGKGEYGRLSPPPLTSDEMKEALQREAYDAVLADAKSWALVSVHGHGVKEEEL